LHFLIVNPAVREAAGRTAKKRIEEQYQWQNVAEDIEQAYFNIMGWKLPELAIRKPNASAVSVGDGMARRVG